MIKKNMKIILAFLLGMIITIPSVYAVTKYLASDVTYKDTTVENALNDLYETKKSTCDKSLVGTEWEYAYIGKENTFVAPCNGVYKLEAWGAQGGSYNATYYGGYGAYSVGNIELNTLNKLYVNVGGSGSLPSSSNYTTGGGYNGGGAGHLYNCSYNTLYGGGGATHIASEKGLLSSLQDKLDSIYLVSAGGSGAYYCTSRLKYAGKSGGGIKGVGEDSYVGTQTTGVAFGMASGNSKQYILNSNYSGGGGGLYGGKGYWDGYAGGGSSYIGNSRLTNKAMYCYNCTESNDENTKTISVKDVSATPTSNYAKQGNGYVKITLISLK